MATAAKGRSERLAEVLSRDGHRCVWCRRELGTRLVRPTLEHVVPKLKGGPAWIENEVAACERCNHQRRHTRPTTWIHECRAEGWDPDVTTVLRALERLEAAIARRGGQRRARPYLARELRVLARSRGRPSR